MRFTSGTLMVGILAILFALSGAYALRAALVTRPAPVASGPRTVNVPMASNNLPIGRKIVLSDISLIPMTSEQAIERKLPLETLMLSTDQIIGRVLRDEIKLGRPFLTTNLYPEGEHPALADKLAPGFRAYTIAMDELGAIGGELLDGSFVDVMFRVPAQAGDVFRRIPPIAETTVTLLENIQIMKINRDEVVARAPTGLDVRNQNRAPTVTLGAIKSVTMAVTPDQANILKAASGRGEIALRLRNGSEASGKSSLGPVTLEKLLGVTAIDAAGIVPAIMTIYRGTGGAQAMAYGPDNYFFGTTGSGAAGYGAAGYGAAGAGVAGYGAAGYGAGLGGLAGGYGLGGYGLGLGGLGGGYGLGLGGGYGAGYGLGYGAGWGNGFGGGYGAGWGGGFGGGYGGGGAGGWNAGGSQASGGGLRPHGNFNGPAAGAGAGAGGYGAGGAGGFAAPYAGPGGFGGMTPNQTILPYPGLPPRGGAAGSMYSPMNQGPNQAMNGMFNPGMTGAFNMGNVQANAYGMNSDVSPYGAYNLQ